MTKELFKEILTGFEKTADEVDFEDVDSDEMNRLESLMIDTERQLCLMYGIQELNKKFKD